jgi:hypothetical protein
MPRRRLASALERPLRTSRACSAPPRPAVSPSRRARAPVVQPSEWLAMCRRYVRLFLLLPLSLLDGPIAGWIENALMSVVPADAVVLVPCFAEPLQDLADPASLANAVALDDHQIANLAWIPQQAPTAPDPPGRDRSASAAALMSRRRGRVSLLGWCHDLQRFGRDRGSSTQGSVAHPASLPVDSSMLLPVVWARCSVPDVLAALPKEMTDEDQPPSTAGRRALIGE